MTWSEVVVLLPPGQRLGLKARLRFLVLAFRWRSPGRVPDPVAVVRVLLTGKTGDLPRTETAS